MMPDIARDYRRTFHMSNIGVRFTRPDGSQFVMQMLSRADARRHAAKYPDVPTEIVVRGNARPSCTDESEPWRVT